MGLYKLIWPASLFALNGYRMVLDNVTTKSEQKPEKWKLETM